jgi:hypothetical protein
MNNRYLTTGYPSPHQNKNSRESATAKASRDPEGTKLFQRVNLAYQGIINQLNLTFKHQRKTKMGLTRFQPW